MDPSPIEFDPLSSQSSHESPRPPVRSRATTVSGWTVIGLAVMATTALAVLATRDDGTRASPEQPATVQPAVVLPTAAAGPRVEAAVHAYRACLPVGGGSADAMERQTQGCHRELVQALFPGDRSDPCVPSAAGSADSMERSVERCRRRFITALLAPVDPR
jgi:hypothetical protein